MSFNFDQVHGIESPISQNDSDKESEISDTVYDESLLRCLSGLVGSMIMSDKQVGAETDQLPEDENHNQVIRQSDTQHGKHEDGKSTEVAGFRIVIRHVAQAEYVNEETNKRYHE